MPISTSTPSNAGIANHPRGDRPSPTGDITLHHGPKPTAILTRWGSGALVESGRNHDSFGIRSGLKGAAAVVFIEYAEAEVFRNLFVLGNRADCCG